MSAPDSETDLRHLPAVLTVEQAARLLHLGRSTAYEAVKTGHWPTRVVRVGRCIRIPTADLLRVLGLSNDATLLDTKEHRQ